MSYCYERNNLEIKNEFTEFLLDMLVPLLQEGFRSMYDNADTISKQYEVSARDHPGLDVPGTLKIFQIFLKDIPNLNAIKLGKEASRIKSNCGGEVFFDKLVRSVIKSNIIMLTFNSSEETCKTLNRRHHNAIDVNLFIHKCYNECAKNIYHNPELFASGRSTVDVNRINRDCRDLLRKSVLSAIRSMLPMGEIVEEYLHNEKIKKPARIDQNEILRMREKLDEVGMNKFDDHNVSLLESSDDNESPIGTNDRTNIQEVFARSGNALNDVEGRVEFDREAELIENSSMAQEDSEHLSPVKPVEPTEAQKLSEEKAVELPKESSEHIPSKNIQLISTRSRNSKGSIMREAIDRMNKIGRDDPQKSPRINIRSDIDRTKSDFINQLLRSH